MDLHIFFAHLAIATLGRFFLRGQAPFSVVGSVGILFPPVARVILKISQTGPLFHLQIKGFNIGISRTERSTKNR